MNEPRLPGISGMALAVPSHRVLLSDLAAWTSTDASKLHAVVGRSFRMCGPDQNAYTLAAEAVMALIDRNDIDPRRVGMLALGTESSTDNAAGAVIVRGMVDVALAAQGRPTLARDCEVPEIKHACLGGIYALAGACRFVATDGRHRQAIVVAADVAEYARGSSGEPTQGAGAVAMLVEATPRLLEIDLAAVGRSSAYRGVDFRKPVRRLADPDFAPTCRRHHDFPVFNGRYSTLCYVDAVLSAHAAMPDHSRFSAADLVFMHRPYARMPEQALAVLAIADAAQRGDLVRVAALADVSADALAHELAHDVDLWAHAQAQGLASDPRPVLERAARVYRGHPEFRRFADRMSLGADVMMDLGNLYTASLPAWIAAGLDAAADDEARDLAGRTGVAIGYGSGDAAEIVPFRVVAGWREAARRIAMNRTLEGGTDLSRDAYEALHDRGEAPSRSPSPRFGIRSIGRTIGEELTDVGIEHYAFDPNALT